MCLEGLARGLQTFLKKEQPPIYKAVRASSTQRVHVTPNVAAVRPFVVAAILRNVTFNPTSYSSFIDLQDKLHQNICRKRTLVAIGTHDLDTVKGPFKYDALKPEDIKFVPLNRTTSMNGVELMEALSVRALLVFYVATAHGRGPFHSRTCS